VLKMWAKKTIISHTITLRRHSRLLWRTEKRAKHFWDEQSHITNALCLQRKYPTGQTAEL